VNAVTRLSFAPNLLSESAHDVARAKREEIRHDGYDNDVDRDDVGNGYLPLIIVGFAVLGIAASIKYLRA
jgi:hypothetical protein